MFNSKLIIEYVLSALAVLIIISVHEYAHAYAAYKLGDNTARNLGRLSLNPLKHLDPFGALCMILFRFGWAKPVPINARNFRNPKRDFAIVALAGPFINLAMAFISAFLCLFTIYLVNNTSLNSVVFGSETAINITKNFITFIRLFHSINVGLAVFNLIPIPPLDGSRILNVVLPPKTYFKIMKYERITYFILIGWLLLGGYVTDMLQALPVINSSPVLMAISNIFDLSGMLSLCFEKISASMMSFWSLLPFLNS